jgi:hypothetical protein
VKDSKTGENFREVSKEDVLDLARPSAVFSPASVRHHWAPQFRSDSQPGFPYCSVRKGKTTTRVERLQNPERPLFSPSSSAARNAPQSWLGEPQGPSLFGPFASLEPQRREGPTTTLGQQSCKSSQACSTQHVVSPFCPEDPLREAVAATHRALLMDSFKSASQTISSQNTTETETETETPALGPPETAMADKRATGGASTHGVSSSWPICVTRAKAVEFHDCVYEDYIDSNRAYPPSPNKTKDPGTHLWNALLVNSMPLVVPYLRAHKSSNTTGSDQPSLLTRPVDAGTQCPVPVITGLGAYTPMTSTGHLEPHYAPLTPAQASRNLLSRRHCTNTPIKADVKNDLDAMLARHNSRRKSTATVQAPPLPLSSRGPMMSLTTSPTQTTRKNPLQPHESRNTEEEDVSATLIEPLRTSSSCCSMSSFEDLDDHVQISAVSTVSISDDWEDVETFCTPPGDTTDLWLFSIKPDMSDTTSSGQPATPDYGYDYDYAYSPLVGSISGWSPSSSSHSMSHALSSLSSPSMSTSSGLQ